MVKSLSLPHCTDKGPVGAYFDYLEPGSGSPSGAISKFESYCAGCGQRRAPEDSYKDCAPCPPGAAMVGTRSLSSGRPKDGPVGFAHPTTLIGFMESPHSSGPATTAHRMDGLSVSRNKN